MLSLTERVVLDLFNALDKGNLGNAQTDGLSDDLNFKEGQYNLIVSIFFVPFVIFAPPFAMLAKKYNPARALPIMMFTCVLEPVGLLFLD